jgi:hypothetical protein
MIAYPASYVSNCFSSEGILIKSKPAVPQFGNAMRTNIPCGSMFDTVGHSLLILGKWRIRSKLFPYNWATIA